MIDDKIQFVHPSLADIAEKELVDQLMADPYWRSNFLGLHGMPKERIVRQRVSLMGAPGGNFQGDVDLLFCDPRHFDEAVAVEVKRIKFGMRAIRTGRPNKLPEYKKAVAQANRLARIGFWQAYLYVIVVVDTREQNLGKVTYDGLSSKLKSIVDTQLSTAALDNRVGLLELEFVQPSDHAPLTVSSSGAYLRRHAKPAPQPLALTEWVKQKMKESSYNHLHSDSHELTAKRPPYGLTPSCQNKNE